MNRMMRIIAAGFALSVATTLNADTFTWTGGANDNKLASGANWDVGKSPSDGAALVFNSTSALTLTNDISPLVSIGSITFDEDCGIHTITGNEIHGVSSVKNNSSVTNEIAVPVYFADSIPATDRNTIPVNFSGGVTATKLLNTAGNGYVYNVMGKYTLTATSEEATMNCHRIEGNTTLCLLGEGSVLDFKGAVACIRGGTTSYADGGILYAEKGATVKCPYYCETASDQKIGKTVYSGGSRQVGFRGPGKFIVESKITHGRCPLFYNVGESSRGYPYVENEIVTVYCNNYVHNKALNNSATTVRLCNTRLVVGTGGLGIASDCDVRPGNDSLTIGAQGNYYIYGSGKILLNSHTLTFDTQNPDTGVGHSVIAQHVIIQGSGTLLKTGAGLLHFKTSSGTWGGDTIVSNGVMATDVSNPFGVSSVSVLSNAILRVATEGVSITNAVAIKKGGILNAGKSVFANLALEDGARLLVRLTDGTSGFYATNTLSIADGAKVKVSLVGCAENGESTVLTAAALDVDNFELDGSYGDAALSVVDTDDGYQALKITGYTVGANEWTGEGDGTTLSDSANWSLGRAPLYYEDILFNQSAGGTLVNDLPDYGMGNIEFGSSAGAYVFSGNPFSRVATFTNSTSSVQTFNNAVSFNYYYSVMNEGGLDFAGGAVASAIGSVSGTAARTLKGNITLVNNWTVPASRTWTVPSGSTFNGAHVECGKSAQLYAEEGAVVNLKSFTQSDVGNNNSHGLAGKGRFNVAGDVYHERYWLNYGNTVIPNIWCESFFNHVSRNTFLNNVRLDVGLGGVLFGCTNSLTPFHEQVFGEVTFGAQSSYTITNRTTDSTFKFSEDGARLVFDTEDQSTGIGHLITLSVPISCNGTTGADGKVIKLGSGTLVLHRSDSTYPGGTIISNGNVAVTADNVLGAGAVSVESGAELELLGGSCLTNAVSLASGAVLKTEIGGRGDGSAVLGPITVVSGTATLKVAGDVSSLKESTTVPLAGTCTAASLANLSLDSSRLTLPNAGWRVKAKLEGGALALRVIRPPFVLLVR